MHFLDAPDRDTALRVRQNILIALRELADREWQQRVWVEGRGPQVSSFVECVCSLYDDSTLGEALETDEKVFDADTDQVLRDLRKLVVSLDATSPAADLIASPVWEEVVRTARRAYDLIARGAPRGR